MIVSPRLYTVDVPALQAYSHSASVGRRAVTPAATADSLQLFLKDIGKVRLLTAQEEVELAKRIERGDHGAKQAMVEANLRLVVSIAKRYRNVRGREMLWLASARRTLASLNFGPMHEVINASKSLSIAELLHRNVVVELDPLTEDNKTFLVEALILWIYACLGNKLIRRNDPETGHIFNGTLRAGGKCADRLYFIAPELDTVWLLTAERENINDSAPNRNFTCIRHNLAAPETFFNE